MTYQQILFERRERTGLITLNRPERMNAWTRQMSAELSDVIEQNNQDPDTGALVITGAGRGFCAGADIQANFKARLDGEASESGDDASEWVALLRRSKPVIAAVNGASIGVGLTMILPCDVILASEAARFGFGFIRMGLTPELASSHFAVQRMGFGRASERLLSGRVFSAAEAHADGLVDRLVSSDELLPRALEIAADMAANPSPQLRWIKQLLTENGSECDLAAVQQREQAMLQAAYGTPEHQEAVSAFLEKRPPNFRS